MQSNSPPGYGSSETFRKQMHVWDYLHIVQKYLLTVILVTLLSLVAAFVITTKQPRLYRATATLEIIPPWYSTNDVAPNMLSDDRYLATQLDKLRMPSVIQQAVQKSDLMSLAGFQGKNEQQIVKMLAGNVNVSLRRNQYLVDVSVTGENKDILHHAANAIVENFRLMQRSEGKTIRDNHRANLELKRDNAESAIRLLESEKRSHLQGRGFTEETFAAEEDRIRKELELYTNRRAEANIEILRKSAVYKQFDEALRSGEEAVEALETHPEIRFHPTIREITDDIEDLLEQRRSLMANGAGRADRNVQLLQQRIDALIALRKRKVRDIVLQFVRDHKGRLDEIEDLEAQIVIVQRQLQTNAETKNQLDFKNREIERHITEKANSSRELERLVAENLDDRDTVRVTQRASAADTPFSPNKPLNLTLGLVLGLLAGVGLAFLRDYLDDTVRTKDELAGIAPDVPLLGIVPRIEARKSDVQKKDLYAHTKPKSTISEAYRGVRTALTLSTHGPRQKVLLLTSAGPREGKTTTSINLATVLGYSGGRTLIVDADLRKPRIHKSFDRPNAEGLTNAIVNGGDPADYCLTTDVERVDLLPSGPIPPNPSELLGRTRMREIIDRLRSVYDTIIIDTPPIGAVTDAAVIATMVDAVILVVHAGKTRRQIVSRGLEQLRYINAPIAGVILNNLQIRGRYYPGYYHYYYYYTSYYGADERSVRGKDAKNKGFTSSSSSGGSGESS